jgi:alcohol dehydrogenase class IV
MTLITYPTRVHFADDVLEEALHSELERAGCVAPLLLMAHHPQNLELEDRVRAGLPVAAKADLVTYSPDSDLRAIAKDVASPGFTPDVIIAFGTARAIELARKCRYAFAQRSQQRLPLYAIPSVDGLPGPCTRNLESWRAGLPSVLICDPTVALGAGQVQSQRSSMLSLVRCCESYLANAYNPPADGMALDGLNRCVINLPKIGKIAGVDLQRELMAASLNAALSQEKGIGPALAMSAVLMQATDGADEADIARLVLPSVIQVQNIKGEKADALLKVLGQDDLGLDLAMGRVLDAVDGPSTLAELGVPRSALAPAAKAAVGKAGLGYDMARRALDNISEEALT